MAWCLAIDWRFWLVLRDHHDGFHNSCNHPRLLCSTLQKLTKFQLWELRTWFPVGRRPITSRCSMGVCMCPMGLCEASSCAIWQQNILHVIQSKMSPCVGILHHESSRTTLRCPSSEKKFPTKKVEYFLWIVLTKKTCLYSSNLASDGSSSVGV